MKNVGSDDYGMLKMCADCEVVCDLLIIERLNVSQLELDGGSVISKIIETEKNIKVEFEYIHAITKKDNDERGNGHGNNLVLERDYKAREERVKIENEHKNINIRFRVNVCLKHWDRHCERKISKLIKKIDIMRKVEECFQKKHG